MKPRSSGPKRHKRQKVIWLRFQSYKSRVSKDLVAVKNGHPCSLSVIIKSGTITNKTGNEVDGAVAIKIRTTDFNNASQTISVLTSAVNTPLNSNLMTVVSPVSNIIMTTPVEAIIKSVLFLQSQPYKQVGEVGLEALHLRNFSQEMTTIQIMVVAEEAEISIKVEISNMGAGQGAVTLLIGQEKVKCVILLCTRMTTEGNLHLSIRCTKKDGSMAAHPITIVGDMSPTVECGSHLFSTRRDTKSRRCSKDTCLSLSNTTGTSGDPDLDRRRCLRRCNRASNESKIFSESPANLKMMSITDSL